MKDKILKLFNQFKDKLFANKKFQALYEKLTTNKQLKALYEQIIAKTTPLLAKLREKNKKDTEKADKFKRVIGRRLKKIFSLRSVSVVIAFLISVPAIAFFGYSYWQDYSSKSLEDESVKRIINSNLNHGTVYLIKQLKHQRIKKKQLRRIIKKLNDIDERGRMHRFSPCDETVLMYSESPAPGTIVIDKPEDYIFELTSYDCNACPLTTKTIKLKQPPLVPRKKSSKKAHNKKDSKTKQEKENLSNPDEPKHPAMESQQTVENSHTTHQRKDKSTIIIDQKAGEHKPEAHKVDEKINATDEKAASVDKNDIKNKNETHEKTSPTQDVTNAHKDSAINHTSDEKVTTEKHDKVTVPSKVNEGNPNVEQNLKTDHKQELNSSTESKTIDNSTHKEESSH